jgi:hypothetical protein
MRFVSHIRALQLIIVPTAARFSNYGDRIIDRPGYVAQFTQDDVTDADVEYAEKVFVGKIKGRTTETDEVTLTPLLSRISVFDTDEKAIIEHWTPDFKEQVERKMLAVAEQSEEFALVEAPPATMPWPRYMEFDGTLEELLDKIVADGYDLREVLRFEEQQTQRKMVIEALKERIAEQDALTRNAEIVNA